MTPSAWDTGVENDGYAGHPGLRYRSAPGSPAELICATSHFSDRTFLVHGARRITYSGFRRALGPATEHLRSLGIRPGDRVLLFGYNSPEWVVALWALWLTGAVPVLGNRWWGAAEIEHAITLLAPRHVLTDSGSEFSAPTSALGELAVAIDDPAEREPELGPQPDPDDPALILFTSGSSGMPKAVELSGRSVICNQQNILGRTNRFPDLIPADAPQVVSLATTPMFHIGGLSSLITHFLTGGRIVLAQGRFDAGQILGLIEAEKIQIWGAVPTMAVRLLEHPDFGRHDLTSLRSWPLGGAPVSAELLDRIRAKLPNLRRRGLSNTWGMTEAGGFLTVADGRDLLDRPGTVGRPYPVVELRIDAPDETGTGEILARSPTVMRGYVGKAEDIIDTEGWLSTGDLGHLDADGYLYIDGRRKDVVIRGGENIACPHVEAALITHPAVIEAAAIGLTHPDLGEELAAVVVYRDGDTPPTVDVLHNHLTGLLSSFAIPTRWEIRTTPLPTLAGEKIDKQSLIAEFPSTGEL
ncbi:class I adenylate-forming enzyme family protein [Mycobacterium sp. LTG2003]